MAQLFETMMLVCFGVSWPVNIIKSLRSKTAKGKSLAFELCILTGYAVGLAGKLVTGTLTYVVIVYVLDLVMVTIDLVLTLRNMKWDKQRAAQER